MCVKRVRKSNRPIVLVVAGLGRTHVAGMPSGKLSSQDVPPQEHAIRAHRVTNESPLDTKAAALRAKP